jgi:hypothetical protein
MKTGKVTKADAFYVNATHVDDIAMVCGIL